MLGVVGCGTAAWVGHLPWIWAHPATNIAAVCDAKIERAHEAQTRYAVPVATADYRELLDDPNLNAVVICTPPSTHVEITGAAAAAGKNILLEKPMARSVAECDAILESASRANVTLMLGHEKRFNVALAKVRDILSDGVIGRPFYLAVNWGASVKLAPDHLTPEGYGDGYLWRWTDVSVGGGIIQDHLPHYVDLWRWWMASEVESVFARLQNVTRDFLDRPEIGVWEDNGTVLMKFRNGAVGSFQTGTVGRGLSPILHNGSGIGEWSEFGCIFGTRGQIVFDLPPWDSPENGRIMVWSLERRSPHDRGWYQVEMLDPRRAPGGPLTPATNQRYTFYRQLDAFVRAIRDGTKPAATGEDGRATLEVVEAAYESQRTGQNVRIQHAGDEAAIGTML